MKLTRKSEYALLMLLYLARQKGKKYIPLSKISKKTKIPIKYLEHIAAAMCKGGFIISIKGNKGGYKLLRNSRDISIAEIIRFFDGALAPVDSVSKYFYRKTPIEKEKKILSLLREIRNFIADKLENTSLKDLI